MLSKKYQSQHKLELNVIQIKESYEFRVLSQEFATNKRQTYLICILHSLIRIMSDFPEENDKTKEKKACFGPKQQFT